MSSAPYPPAQGVLPLVIIFSYRLACWQLERIKSGLVPWIPLSTSSTPRLGKVTPGKVVIFFLSWAVCLLGADFSLFCLSAAVDHCPFIARDIINLRPLQRSLLAYSEQVFSLELQDLLVRVYLSSV